MTHSPRHRRCLVLRGEAPRTATLALACVADLPPEDVLWISHDPAPAPFVSVAPGAVRRLLGRSFDAVVIDLHAGPDPDVLGQCQGFIRGGGALVVRLDEVPAAATPALAIFPYRAEDAGARFAARLDRRLPPDEGPVRLRPALRAEGGTPEQAALVAHLAAALAGPTPRLEAVLSDRGRGKSAALGLALAGLPPGLRVAVTAGQRAAADEVFRFAGPRPPPFVPLADLAFGAPELDVIVVDEAAQLPVPLLQQLVVQHPAARIAFATTAHGYEGTGRGFVLRFLRWAEGQPRPLTVRRLRTPIRWDADDPLEARVFDALLLDAEPCPDPGPFDAAELTACQLDRTALAQDETRLRDFFGLLVQAHYRTTPGDLHRLLDAPNVDLHAVLLRGRVVAATLVAHEGGLPEALCAALYHGAQRIRGHALAETLVCHSGRPEAGPLRMVRSVRIATHPAVRRRGLGQRLIDHVHASYTPDLFGTLFGITPELLSFRRQAGYRLVRLGASRGSRTGEPAAVMVRPVSAAARALVDRLQGDLARDLPLQLALMRGGGEVIVDAAFGAALAADLPPPRPLDAAEADAMVANYAFGPRTLEAAATAVSAWLAAHPDAVATLPAADRALVEARVHRRLGWDEATRLGGQPSIPAAMRALRRVVRALVEHVGSPAPPAPFHAPPPVV